ncbi:MAG: hypothetical protein KAT25_03770 [Sulfuriflexus sp.]|nr:hypothetical protein [Sulfuriflexus sp.]
MKSLQISIYDYEEVLFTLAWLFNCNAEILPKKVVNKAVQLGLITIHSEKHWNADANKISRHLNSFKVKFPHHSQTKDLTNILIGFGEFSARSHGDFKDILSKKFSTFIYKGALSKILKEVVETKHFLKRKRNLEETGYFQTIAKTNFDWKGYHVAMNTLNYRGMSTYNYGLAFIAKICLRVIPSQFSAFVEKHKIKPIVGDLCAPVIEPLMFRDEQYIIPLLKSKNAYLKLLACASVVQQDPFENQSTIDENIKMLVANGVDIRDAIWMSSVKLRDHYLSVERTNNQIKQVRQEILRCEKDPSNCQKGIKPAQWISSRKDILGKYEKSLAETENKLKESFNEMAFHWPKEGLEKHQIENIICLIKNEKLSRELVELIPSKENQEQLLDNTLTLVMGWIGISSKSILESCEETFSYSSEKDLQRIVNAAKTLVMLSKIKKKVIGKFLGNAVGASVNTLENFVSSPYMSVRKPSQWQSATSRLASIHLLAMCVFEETHEDKENEISVIVPKVVENINLLLKVRNTPFHLGADELFKDLKRITAYIISAKSFLAASAKGIAIDEGLPPDYRARVIVTNKSLLVRHKSLLLEFFEEFGRPPIYVDRDYKHFSSWVCLLDICISHCWKFEAILESQEIIRIWEQHCSLYGNKCEEYVEYAKKLFMALSEDGKEREWLIGLDGFEQSNCMDFLKNTLSQND